ncbi:hypothetical protein [Sinanaerobacter chloroacetimidivorans]|uniref:Uncharacterized protein n=1 Tax=Sinanaerobacter chloroacetimidivorans TaxID=2818044 RepID=A0A8J8B3R0_9FIRM|nr:hypothetical protein [Sinanaerobacter chloroacetimidivorans]MBR0600594.1 hypothetical protein [Sinanaerobacter chloroacetimidivorans]
MKDYSYRTGYYLVSILGPNIMMIGVLLWGIYDRLSGNNSLIHQFIITVIPLLLLSSFVAMNQPRRITDDGDNITFYGFFQKHAYKWSEIEFLRIRRFIMTDRVLVRIGKERVLGGRYWLDTDSLQGSRELLEKMIPYDPLYELNNKAKAKRKKK